MSAAVASRLARIAICGPMVGRNPGFVTTQGEFLTDLLRESGHNVISVSVEVGRVRRFLDIVRTLMRELPTVDALIVETYSGPSFVVEEVATLLGTRARVPVVLHLHGGLMPQFARRYPRWAARVIRQAAAIVAPSAFLARELEPFSGAVRVIPNVIELDTYPFRLREHVAPRLFWMRAYHEIYNPVMAVRVLALVRREFPEATLVMAGQAKGMTSAVAEAIRALDLGDAVELLGFLDDRGKREMAARCDIFINTTHVDNAPVGVVEMCALGLPVVSTSVGGVPDLLTHERTALLVPDGDEPAMAAAIERLVREPELAARLSRNGPALAAQCAWPAVRTQWEALFGEILSGSRRSA